MSTLNPADRQKYFEHTINCIVKARDALWDRSLRDNRGASGDMPGITENSDNVLPDVGIKTVDGSSTRRRSKCG